MSRKQDDRISIPKTPAWAVKLRSINPTVGTAERKVSEYILHNTDKAIYQTITEVAEAAQVSEATVVRLCRRLGHKGFQGLRIALAKSRIPPLRVIHEDVKDTDDVSTIKEKVFCGSIKVLQDTLSILENSELERTIKAITSAVNFDIYGLGGSGIIAEDACHKFMKIGIRAKAFSDCNLQAMSAALLGSRDVAMGISHSGSVIDVVEALQIAKSKGATTICITHSAKSPITKVSDIKIFTSANEMMFRSDAMETRIVHLAIIDTLYVGVALELREKATRSLDLIRQAVANKGY
jgi:DNA-binding MurR/RpiR family transcriptional regulator